MKNLIKLLILISIAGLTACGEEAPVTAPTDDAKETPKAGVVKPATAPTTDAAVAPVNSETLPVSGYTKENGTQVEPYERTAPNESKADNFIVNRKE